MKLGWAFALLTALPLRSVSATPRPVAWAAQSPRPAACLETPRFWGASRRTPVERACRELSRIQALLARAPEGAFRLASALVREEPKLAAARVLRGRASLRLGQTASALADLSPLLEGDAESTADAAALLDGGRAALGESNLVLAARFYRALGSRASLLPERTQQTVAYLEIAAVLLATEPEPGAEVLGYLREAKRHAVASGFFGLQVALTALTWSAKARDAEALAALSELADPWLLERFESAADEARLAPEVLPGNGSEPSASARSVDLYRAPPVWLPDGLLHAAQGFALERRDPALARGHYRAFAHSELATTKMAAFVARRLALGPVGRAPR